MKLLKRSLMILTITVLLLLLFGSVIGKGLSLHLASINNRMLRQELTLFDKIYCAALYNSMIYMGGLAYPEAADILDHYINGEGQDLQLDPEYLKTSLVITNHLQKMRVGESRTVSFRQHEDWRLSYAINGFQLKKLNGKAFLSQYIVFSKDKRIYTDLNFFFFKVRVPDGLVHALEPTPFTVSAEWKI